MLFSLLTLARKAYNFRKATNDDATTTKAKTPMPTVSKLRLFAALPVTITTIAFLLSFLCVFAGSKPGIMDDYAVFTLNMSRIGENILQNVDSKIAAVHFKRSEPASTAAPMITAPPTTLLALTRRADIASDFGSLTSKVAGGVNSAESAARSKASSAIAAAKTNLVKAVNNAYHGAIEDLDLQDFYAVHISSSCTGTYKTKDGKNITIGDSSASANGTRAHVDSCEKHLALNPLQLVRILYWISVVLTGITLCLGIVGIVRPSAKLALINVFGTLPAFLFLGLASAVTHGVSSGAGKLVKFVGQHIGVTGKAGQKFLQLTWAVVVLLIVNMALWIIAYFLIKHAARNAGAASSKGVGWSRKRPDRTSGIGLGPVTPVISEPMSVHSNHRYDGFI